MGSRMLIACLLLSVSGCLWGQEQSGSGGSSASDKQAQGAPADSSKSGQQEKGQGAPDSSKSAKPNPTSADQTQADVTVTPDSAAAGDAIEIKGSSFGKKGKVTIGGQDAPVSSWKDDQILAVVPNGAASGKAEVSIQANGEDKPSHHGTLDVKPPAYDKSAFEVLTGIGASFLPVESTGYKVDSTTNALSQTNVGRKHLELLLGGAFILPMKTIYKKQGNSDPDYKNFHPLEAFLSLRFAPGADQTFTGFVVGGGWRVHKYLSLLVGYSLTPIDEPTSGFRRAAAQVVAANPTIAPYNQYNANDLAQNKPGAFDGFPLFLYNSSGVTTTKIFPTSPTVTHARSGIFFGVGIPLNLGALLKPGSSK